MRILFIHPNYRSGGAEIAGNWPPAWAAYLTGALKGAGYDDIHFVDAMTNDLSEEQVRAILEAEQPDLVGVTAITPSIYKAERLLQMVKEIHPEALTVLGGIHGTFMYQQVLTEAPWIDVIARGEGEEIIINIVSALDRGHWLDARGEIKGLAYRDQDQIVATPSAPTIKNLDGISPDWSILEWSKYIYLPLNTRVAIPNMARGCPFTCSFCSQWKFWRDYRIRVPKTVVDEIEGLVRDHDVGFFILADEEPTINKRKFVQFCEELIDRDLNILWGINTRVTDILRDEALLPFYRRAGLIHVSLGTEAAAQLKLDRDWKPDLANWAMYTPWPFSDLFQELGDKVEVFDYDKYNFVTPIMKPDAMERSELLDRVMHNYRRFYSSKALFSYPWAGYGQQRRYLLGCLKAFLKAGFERTFYDLGRVNYWGPQSKGKVDFGFDGNRKRASAPGVEWKTSHNRKLSGPKQAELMACGGSTEQMSDAEPNAANLSEASA